MATKRLDAHVEPMRDVHVVSHYDSWAVRRDGGVRVSRLANSQEEAIEIAERMAKRDKVSLVIHDIEGNVQNRSNYGAASHGVVATAWPSHPEDDRSV